MGAGVRDYLLSDEDDDLVMDANFQEFEQAMGLGSPGNIHSNESTSPLSTVPDHTDSSSSTTFSHVDGPDDMRFLSSMSLSSLQRSGSYGGRLGSSESNRFVTAVMEKVVLLKTDLSVARDEMNDLRQEAGELQEYSNAKLTRITRYLGVLADKARTLDQVANTAEERIAPLQKERKKLFNDLLNAKGSIRVFCRVRPQFEDEGATTTSFPNVFTVQVNQAAGAGSFQPAAAKKDFEFDHVYGPHVSQSALFQDIQPLMTSVMDGYNACVLAYGQTGAGKTHTMEGAIHDRGIYYRAFDELFDLANSSMTVSFNYVFHVSVVELYNEQLRDLLWRHSDNSAKSPPKNYELKQTKTDGVVVVELTEEKVETPAEFAKVMKIATLNRTKDGPVGADRVKRSHLVVTIHVRCTNSVTREKHHSKLHLADLAGSERLREGSGDRLTESLFINKSLSSLGDCLSALTAKKGSPPFGNSKLSLLLSDAIGGESKTIMIVNCSPGQRDGMETVASLNFATRARNVELSLGSKDTIKKWRDMANDARKELHDKERQCEAQQQEILAQRQDLQSAEEQAVILFEELQRAWTVAASLQSEASVEKTRSFQLQAEVEHLQRKAAEANEIMQELEHQQQRAHDLMVIEHEEQLRMLREEWETRLVLKQAQHAETLQKVQEETHAERSKSFAAYEVRIHQLQQQLIAATAAAENAAAMAAVSRPGYTIPTDKESDWRKEYEKAQEEIARLKGEVQKNSELAERLNQENERLVTDLMEKTAKKESEAIPAEDSEANDDEGNEKQEMKLQPSHSSKYWLNLKSKSITQSMEEKPRLPRPHNELRVSEAAELHLTGRESRMKRNQTEDGAQLITLLDTFEFDKFENSTDIAERANKVLREFLATVETHKKGEKTSEGELLAELRDSVFSFLGRVQPRCQLDGNLVAQLRLLYLKGLLAKMPDLKPNKIPEVCQFLEREGGEGKTVAGKKAHFTTTTPMGPGPIPGVFPMRVSLKPEKKLQKLLSFGSKNKVEATTEAKREANRGRVNELVGEAKQYAVNNEALALLFTHTDMEEVKRQIRRWLAENFDHLPISGGTELAQFTMAIFDGWLSGCGTIKPKGMRDVFGDILANYSRRSYESQLHHLMDLSSTLAVEEVDDLVTLNRLRTQLESVDLKRRKIMKEMQVDPVLLDDEKLEPPPLNEDEEARLASLFVLEDALKACEDAHKGPLTAASISKKKFHLAKMLEKVQLMLSMDRAVAEVYLAEAQKHLEVQATTVAESIPSQGLKSSQGISQSASLPGKGAASAGSQKAPISSRESFPEEGGPGIPNCLRGESIEWTAVQFNSRAGTPPVVVKCGATSQLDLVIKVVNGKGTKPGEAAQRPDICVLALPSVLEDLSQEDIVKELEYFPEALKALVMAKTAASTRERYARLYKTLAARIPALQKTMGGAPSPDRSGQGKGGGSEIGGGGGLPLRSMSTPMPTAESVLSSTVSM